MKKILRNNRFIAMAFFTFFLIGFILEMRASEKEPDNLIELKYIWMIGYQPLFELTITSKTGEDQYSIAVYDEYGNALFSEYTRGKKFSKRFLLDMENLGDIPVKFEIYNRKTKKLVTYEVKHNRRYTYTDDMVVNELK